MKVQGHPSNNCICWGGILHGITFTMTNPSTLKVEYEKDGHIYPYLRTVKTCPETGMNVWEYEDTPIFL